MGRFLTTEVGLGCLLLAGIASAQVAISAKSGLINYVEGTVLLDGVAVTMKPGSFPQMQNGSELRTADGRAEVLLAPGVFMRLGENSAVRLLSGEIMDTRVEFLAGSVIVETADMAKEQALTFSMNGAMLGLLNKGLYRLDSEPPQVGVYDGEAWVTNEGQAQILKRGRRLRLDGVAVAEKFDTRIGDDFFLWAGRRAGYLAAANASAAMSAQASGFSGTSGWIWDSFYDTYTFLPGSGSYNSFWGCRFYPPYGGARPPRPGGPSRPGSPSKGPIHFGPRPPIAPGHPGRPPRPGDSGGQMSWGGRPAGPGHSSGGHSSVGGPSGGGSHPGGGHSSVGGPSGGGSHSGGSGYPGGGSHSGGGGSYSGSGGGGGHSSGGSSGGGGSHSSGGGGGSSGGGGSHSSGGSGGGGGNSGSGRGR